jgi:hypothetical protein
MSERREDKSGRVKYPHDGPCFGCHVCAPEKFILPGDIMDQAKTDTLRGVKIMMTPEEVIRRMKMADRALNGASNDAEHDALYALREWLSEVLEDPDRRAVNERR